MTEGGAPKPRTTFSHEEPNLIDFSSSNGPEAAEEADWATQNWTDLGTKKQVRYLLPENTGDDDNKYEGRRPSGRKATPYPQRTLRASAYAPIFEDLTEHADAEEVGDQDEQMQMDTPLEMGEIQSPNNVLVALDDDDDMSMKHSMRHGVPASARSSYRGSYHESLRSPQTHSQLSLPVDEKSSRWGDHPRASSPLNSSASNPPGSARSNPGR